MTRAKILHAAASSVLTCTCTGTVCFGHCIHTWQALHMLVHAHGNYYMELLWSRCAFHHVSYPMCVRLCCEPRSDAGHASGSVFPWQYGALVMLCV